MQLTTDGTHIYARQRIICTIEPKNIERLLIEQGWRPVIAHIVANKELETLDDKQVIWVSQKAGLVA
jgi:hypothetical protein